MKILALILPLILFLMALQSLLVGNKLSFIKYLSSGLLFTFLAYRGYISRQGDEVKNAKPLEHLLDHQVASLPFPIELGRNKRLAEFPKIWAIFILPPLVLGTIFSFYYDDLSLEFVLIIFVMVAFLSFSCLFIIYLSSQPKLIIVDRGKIISKPLPFLGLKFSKIREYVISDFDRVELSKKTSVYGNTYIFSFVDRNGSKDVQFDASKISTNNHELLRDLGATLNMKTIDNA